MHDARWAAASPTSTWSPVPPRFLRPGVLTADAVALEAREAAQAEDGTTPATIRAIRAPTGHRRP